MRNRCKLALAGLLLLCLFPRSFAGQTGYRIIHVGSPIASVPFPCERDTTYCEGEFDGQWVRVGALDGKIITLDVMYSGKTLHREVIAMSPITLAQAIKIHSLQPGFAVPHFGLAKDRDGATYGIADVTNDIVYHCIDIADTGIVSSVSYLSPDAPVLGTAALQKLEASGNSLLQEARLAKPYSNLISPINSGSALGDSTQKAHNRNEAIDGLAERTDKVIGSGKMLLALIGQVSNWYEVDKDHPEAAAKSQDLRNMKSKFDTYWHDLSVYADANQSFLGEQNLEVIPFDTKKEIDSKIRQLEAMGFEE